MDLDDPLDYGQASAGSFALFIYFVEQFEDLIMLSGTYPHPIVPYEENGLISVKAMTDFDVDQFVEALNGKLTDHHRFLLKLHLNDIAFLADKIPEIDDQIQMCMIPFRKENALIQTIQRISKTTAPAIIADIGVNMSQFPSDAHLASWAAICPGNNENAGIKKSGKIRKGNSYLKATLTEIAWAASGTKGSEYSVIYHYLERGGVKIRS